MSTTARAIRPEDAVRRRILRDTAVALAFLGLVAALAFANARLSAAGTAQDTRRVDLAVTERLTVQRLAVQASQIVAAPDQIVRLDAARRLAQTADRLAATHEALRAELAPSGSTGATQRVLRGLFTRGAISIDALVGELLHRVDLLTAPDRLGQVDDWGPILSETHAITQLAEGVLDVRLGNVIARYEQRRAARAALGAVLQIGMLAASLVSLAVVGIFVFDPVARVAGDLARQFDHTRGLLRRKERENQQRIAQVSHMREEYRSKVLHDELTGLANRRYLMEFGNRALANARRQGRLVGLLQIDLDCLSLVNERLGHAAGDTVLQNVAELLSGECRDADFCARPGGDKLVLVVPDATSAQQVEALAERLIRRFTTPVAVEGELVQVGVSIGIALSSDIEGGFSELLSKAHRALEQAKSEGRGRWRRHAPPAAQTHVALTQDAARLWAAIARDRLSPWYVPIVRGGHAEAVEVQMCWFDEQGAMHGSWETARDNGHIVLADRLLEHAVVAGSRAVSRWQAAGYPVRFAMVKVSAGQLSREGFGSRLIALLVELGVATGTIAVEVDAGAIGAMDRAALRCLDDSLRALCEVDMPVVLGNVSSQHALMPLLERVSPDMIRFSSAFTAEDSLTRERRAGFADLANLIEHEGVELIAQAVRSPRHAGKLVMLGCHLQQGTLYGAPMNRALMSAWLRRHRPGTGRDAA